MMISAETNELVEKQNIEIMRARQMRRGNLAEINGRGICFMMSLVFLVVLLV